MHLNYVQGSKVPSYISPFVAAGLGIPLYGCGWVITFHRERKVDPQAHSTRIF